MKPLQLIRHLETKHPNPEPSPESFQGEGVIFVLGLDILKFDKNSTDQYCSIIQFGGLSPQKNARGDETVPIAPHKV